MLWGSLRRDLVKMRDKRMWSSIVVLSLKSTFRRVVNQRFFSSITLWSIIVSCHAFFVLFSSVCLPKKFHLALTTSLKYVSKIKCIISCL